MYYFSSLWGKKISFENQKRNLFMVTELKLLNSVMVLWHECSVYQWSLLTFVKELLCLEEHKSAHSLRVFQGSNGNASRFTGDYTSRNITLI